MQLKNLLPNLCVVNCNDVAVYFSYETPIAYKHNGVLVMSENVWTRTTGKHLNHIKQFHSNVSQIPYREFEDKYNVVVG